MVATGPTGTMSHETSLNLEERPLDAVDDITLLLTVPTAFWPSRLHGRVEVALVRGILSRWSPSGGCEPEQLHRRCPRTPTPLTSQLYL
jgi:hypothetical protein